MSSIISCNEGRLFMAGHILYITVYITGMLYYRLWKQNTNEQIY